MFKKSNRNVYPRSPLRILLMGLILCAVIWGFWQNTEKQLKEINSRYSVLDEPPVLTLEERRGLQEMIDEFKSRYGTDVKMEIISTALQKPETERPVIYLGINQETDEVLLTFPPLLRKVLGDGFQEVIYQRALEIEMSLSGIEFKREFEMPENIVPVALLIMGYPSSDSKPSARHTEYKTDEELIFYNKF